MTETAVVYEIRQRFGNGRHPEVFLLRYNAGCIAGSYSQAISVDGHPDTAGWVKVIGIPIPLGIEAKVRFARKRKTSYAACTCDPFPNQPQYCGMQDKAQRVAQRVMRKAGAIYFVAHDADEAELLLDYWATQARDRILAAIAANQQET